MSTRRQFLAATTTAASLFGQKYTGMPGWYDKPMRWAQLAFTEDDPGNYNPGFWLDYFKRIHADAACLSAGGCVAFYQTKVPGHYKSKFLGNNDSFGELAAGCKKLGMVVVARTDPHAMHEAAYQLHPEWAAVEANGQPRRHWADPSLWVTCAMGPYNFEFMTDVTKEIVANYPVDGVFSNRWSGHGICYCKTCVSLFKAFSGHDLPRGEERRSPAGRAYWQWHQNRLFELWKVWDAEIKKINPHAAFLANSGGGALSELDMKTIGELAPTLFADRQARRGLMLPWSNGKNGKEYRSTMGNKAIGGIFSVGVEEPYRWKDSVQHADEIRIWVADGIAQGLRPWFTKFNAKPYDNRWLLVVEEIYNWHYKNEAYLRNERPLAKVAMVFSQRNAAFYGGAQARAKVEDHSLGYYQALVEARILFEMVHDGLLDAENLKPFQVLILPNIAALSEAQCGQLKAFVDRGGSIVATHESSLYDEWGTRRADFGLGALYGARFAGKVEERVQNSYLNVDAKTAITAGLEDAPRIINGAKWVQTQPLDAGYKAALTLVPSYPDLPMEEVYPRTARTNIPGVYTREAGRGRVVYFPFDLDRTYWEVLSPDHAKLLVNAVRWAMNGRQPLEITGRGILDVALWEQKNSLTAPMVNLTNPMLMKGPFREIYPVGEQTVSIELPAGRKAKSVQLLSNNRKADWKLEGGRVVVRVPEVKILEVVAVDYI